MGIEEIAIGPPHMALWRHAGAAPEHELIAHELAVVLANGARRGLEARVGEIGASRPFPDIAEHLLEPFARRGRHGPEMGMPERAALERRRPRPPPPPPPRQGR